MELASRSLRKIRIRIIIPNADGRVIVFLFEDDKDACCAQLNKYLVLFYAT